ncbi:MAG: hypothetical protein R3A48_12885 [Polyangiales bacterium]
MSEKRGDDESDADATQATLTDAYYDPESGDQARPSLVVRGEFVGPLPPPAMLRAYNEAIPNLGDAIVREWGTEGLHRRAIETSWNKHRMAMEVSSLDRHASLEERRLELARNQLEISERRDLRAENTRRWILGASFAWMIIALAVLTWAIWNRTAAPWMITLFSPLVLGGFAAARSRREPHATPPADPSPRPTASPKSSSATP